MKNIIIICLLFFACLSSSYGQVFPIGITGPTTFCGSDNVKIRLTASQSEASYKVYANGNQLLAVDSLSGSFGLDGQPIEFSIDGSKLKAGINTITITGKLLGQINLINKISPGFVTVDGIETEPYRYTYRINNGRQNTVPNAISYTTVWDDNGLYFAVKVIDNTLTIAPDITLNDYQYDGLELYIDPYSLQGDYGSCNTTQCRAVRQFPISAGNPNNTFRVFPSGRNTAGIVSAVRTFSGQSLLGGKPVSLKTGTGYFVEFFIPWTTFFDDPNAVAPAENFTFGLDIACNDNRNSTVRHPDGQYFTGVYNGFNGLQVWPSTQHRSSV